MASGSRPCVKAERGKSYGYPGRQEELARSTSRERAAARNLAIKYRITLRASENFIGRRPARLVDALDYFVCWCAAATRAGRRHGFSRQWLPSAGASTCVARRRPASARLRCGVVQGCRDHPLHYDHVGNFELFGGRRLHLQDLEMQYATGRICAKSASAAPSRWRTSAGMVRRVYAGRVQFHRRRRRALPESPAPDRRHTWPAGWCGVDAARGWCWPRRQPISTATWKKPPLSHRLVGPDMVRGLDRMRRLAASPGTSFPALSLVLRRYPHPAKELRESSPVWMTTPIRAS